MKHPNWERLGIYSLIATLLAAFWWLVVKAISAVVGW